MGKPFETATATDGEADLLDSADWEFMLATVFEATDEPQAPASTLAVPKWRLIEELREQRQLRMQLEDFDGYVV